MGRPALWWKSVSGWRCAIHHSHSRPILASSPCCCYTTALPPFRFSLRISVVLSHHLSLADRRTDGRLSRVRNAPFLFFTSEVSTGEGIQVRDPCVFLPSSLRGLARIKLPPELMLPAVNSSYFSRGGHLAAAFALPLVLAAC